MQLGMGVCQEAMEVMVIVLVVFKLRVEVVILDCKFGIPTGVLVFVMVVVAAVMVVATVAAVIKK